MSEIKSNPEDAGRTFPVNHEYTGARPVEAVTPTTPDVVARDFEIFGGDDDIDLRLSELAARRLLDRGSAKPAVLTDATRYPADEQSGRPLEPLPDAHDPDTISKVHDQYPGDQEGNLAA